MHVQTTVRALSYRVRFIALAAAMVLIMTANCGASMIIDSFDVGSQFLMLIPGTSSSTMGMTTGMPTSDVIGGSRDIALDYISGSSILYSTVDFVDTNALDFAEGPDSEAKLTVTWDGDTTAGLNSYSLGANFLAGGCNEFVADLASIDLPIKYRLEVYTDASNYSYYENTWAGGTSGLQHITFSQLDLHKVGSGASYNNVGAIRFILNGQGYPDTDLRINYIAAVPEPSIWVLLFSGVAGLGSVIWMRKK
jgi:hypothetical protein